MLTTSLGYIKSHPRRQLSEDTCGVGAPGDAGLTELG